MKKFRLKAVPTSKAIREELGEDWVWYYGKSPWRRGARKLFVHQKKENALLVDKLEADKIIYEFLKEQSKAADARMLYEPNWVVEAEEVSELSKSM